MEGPGDCRIAFWHRPRYSAGAYGGAPDLNPLWNRLVGRARIVLTGHDHNLQRHRPQRGLAQYVVGAGGRGRYDAAPRQPDAGLGHATTWTAPCAWSSGRAARCSSSAPPAGACSTAAARPARPGSVPAVDEPVVILCGGRGTRLREETQTIPKPLVEIGGRPILWHVIRIYADQGFSRFVLCLGHRGDLIRDFVERNGLPDGPHHRVRRHGGGDPHRRAGGARARPARGRGASAPPTRTAWPTSTSPGSWTSMPATARSPR